MKLFSNRFFYFAILISLVFWASAIFAAVKVVPLAFETGFFLKLGISIRENWALISLVISEFAALIPGPWNGIIQVILRIVTKIFERKKEKTC